jgi:ribosomal-protein-alanine N-acetyltransferase
MIIRPATTQDLDAILKIEEVCFQFPWTRQHFLYELTDNPFSFVFVAEVQATIVGYIDWWITFHQGQINNLAVLPQLRHKKIGQTLLNDAISRLNKANCLTITLEVAMSNIAAIKLYQKVGFKTIHTKKKYYENGEDALAMELKLS